MALRVWLPLNGNLKNQGLSNLNIFSSQYWELKSNGKIGAAYKGCGVYHLTDDILSNKWTISLWFLSESAWGPYNDILLCKNNNSSQDCQFYLSVKGGSKLNLGINLHNEQYTYDFNFLTNTWYHAAAAFDGEKYYLYLNGDLVKTGEDTSVYSTLAYNLCIGTRSTIDNGTSNYGGNKTLNDVRIYDECLSQKQIKEISKGLVAHYKLEGIAANENLILRSDKITGGSQASGITRTYMSDGSTKFVAVSGNGNYASISFAEDSKANVGNKLSAGDTYTMSCDILVEEGTKYPDIFINNTNGYKTLEGPTLKTGVWQRVYYTKTWNDPGTSTYGNISLHIGFSSAIGTYYFKNFKLEKGSLTQWTPAPTDPMYKALGYNSILTSDCSGNGYIGAITGSLTHNFNTPRYSGSTSFDGNSYITTAQGSMAWFPFDKCTLSCWLYPTTAPSSWAGSVGVQHNGGAGSKMFSISNYAGKFSVQLDSGTAYVTVQSETLPLNTWTYCAATIEGTTLKMYMNGQLVKTYTLDWGSAAVRSETNFSIGVDLPGGDETFVGSISDVRLYTTVLSAEDILTMYKTSGIIDNKGNVYSYEFKEE